jgi:hypothetical protein
MRHVEVIVSAGPAIYPPGGTIDNQATAGFFKSSGEVIGKGIGGTLHRLGDECAVGERNGMTTTIDRGCGGREDLQPAKGMVLPR